MSLAPRERQALATIEEALCATDPRLAARITTFSVLASRDRIPRGMPEPMACADQASHPADGHHGHRVRVSVGSHKPVPATARPLSAQERSAALAAYAARHPRMRARLKPVLEASLGTRIDEKQTRLPMIAVEVADEDRG